MLKRTLTLSRQVFLTCLIMLLLAGAGLCQENAAGVTIRSSPPGAEVILEGDATVTAITPTTIHYPLIGDYRLTVKRKGFETYRTNVSLDPGRATQLDVELSRKTGVKAAARSMFIPGWGQWYTDQKFKSFSFSFLFAGAVGSYFIFDDRFREKEDIFLSRRDAYDNALESGASFGELQRLRDQLASAQEEAYDAEDARRIAIGAVVGVWALNVLDALLFSPSEPATLTVKGVSITPEADGESFGIKLTHAF